jgi:tetratricopeptide (TPR) repeat protein
MRAEAFEVVRFTTFVLLVACSDPCLAQETIDKFGQRVDQTQEGIVEEAQEHARSGDADKAITLLKDVLSSDQNYYRAWINLGLAYGRKLEEEEAIAALSRASEIQSREELDATPLLMAFSVVYYRLGEYGHTIDYLTKGLEEVGQTSSVSKGLFLGLLGEVYYVTQRFDEAEEYLSQAQELGYGPARTIRQLIEASRELESRPSEE